VGVSFELFITRVCGCYLLTSSCSHHFSSLCIYNPVYVRNLVYPQYPIFQIYTFRVS